MGMSAFNRMRRERSSVEKVEAQRFKNWNEQRHAARDAREKMTAGNDKLAEKASKEEVRAVDAIGVKARIAIESDGKKDPLRMDHAAEIAGRNLYDVDQPKDPVARIDERVPQHVTANEKLTEHTSVEGKGPTSKMVEAAQREAGAIKDDGESEQPPAETVPAPATAEETVAPKGAAETAPKATVTRQRPQTAKRKTKT